MGALRDFLGNNVNITDDKQQKIDVFISYVKDFYDLVLNNWLKDDLAEGLIKDSYSRIRIKEESLGEYEVDELNLTIGNITLQFRPVGTVILGTDARIDMVCRTQRIKIVRTDKSNKSTLDFIRVSINGEKIKKRKLSGEIVWKFVSPDNQKLVTIDSDSMQKEIVSIIKNEIDFS